MLDVLAGLGVDDIAAGFEPVRSLSLETPDGVAAGELRRPDYTIPRYVLDARIVDAAVGAGAELRRHTVKSVRVEADRVVIDDTIAGKVLIGADGAGSMVRRALGHRPNAGRHLAVAMRGYVAFPGLADQRIVTSGPRWPAYAWAFPIGDGTANVGYGEVMRGGPLSRAHLLERMAELLPEIDLADVTRLRAHHLPLSTSRPPHGAGRVLLVGDAQSLINPFTGEGIFYAVLSGSLAGHAAAVAPARAARVLRGRAAPPAGPAPPAQRRGGLAGPHAGGDPGRGPGRRQRPQGLRLDRRARARRRSVTASYAGTHRPRVDRSARTSSSVRPWRRSLVCK